jgi:uncharacterized lipoprotein YddW (UPF0748 family)
MSQKTFIRVVLVCVIIVCSSHAMYSQYTVMDEMNPHPKREFRSVWLTTVLGLDWPRAGSTASQQAHLRQIIHNAKAMGLNTIVMQVVSRGDAMYPSERLPWAPWLTGEPGVDPGWDPMQFAIDEAHKLGMEFHAWYNVYRIGDATTPVSSTREPLHVRFTNPEWIEDIDGAFWLNPGFPELREWLIGNVLEIAENYDIDAIHFDFIRYNTSGYLRDQQLFQNPEYNPDNIQNIGDWRRENINKFVREVHAGIKDLKPWVKVASTPVGHYKQTAEINWPALWGYDAVFQDSRRWLQEEVHDYLAPQIYWGIGQQNDRPRFELLAHDWANEAYGRHVYIGIAAYVSHVFAALPAHIDTSRAAGTQGQIYFRYDQIDTSPPPFADRYQYPALIPIMDWKNTTPPPAPLAFRYDRVPSAGISALQWDVPDHTVEDDEVRRFGIYRFSNPAIAPEDLEDAANMIDFTGRPYYSPNETQGTGNYFVVTSIDRNSNESSISAIIEISSPDIPVLAHPVNEDPAQRDTVDLVWNFAENAGAYRLQLSTDPAIDSGILLDVENLTDTSYVLTNIDGQTTYYWRAQSKNPIGSSGFSEIYSFTTAFPYVPLLVEPLHATLNVPVPVTFRWESDSTATSYNLQVATSMTIMPENIVYEISEIQDTFIVIDELASNTNHFWRVSAANEFGTSRWSVIRGFRTAEPVTVADRGDRPEKFLLHQNYPNPFNATTTIVFEIPEERNVSLRIFDMLGREVAVLMDEHLTPGIYRVPFDASGLSSGMYIYQLRAGEYIRNNRMMYLK